MGWGLNVDSPLIVHPYDEFWCTTWDYKNDTDDDFTIMLVAVVERMALEIYEHQKVPPRISTDWGERPKSWVLVV